jgi:putative Holliday junction resolvase
VNKPRPKRLLGIDFGLSRLGLALSDERKLIASPFLTFSSEKKTEETARKLIDLLTQLQEKNGYEIEEIIIGMPLMMSGKTGFLADEVNHFINVLSQVTSIPIHSWDERLSTVQAERSLRETQLSRKRRSKVVDIVSAAIILQSYLDHRNSRINSENV